MKNKIIILLRLFFTPIILTIIHFYFSDLIFNYKNLLVTFSIAFTLNWILDKTIIQKSIDRGKKLTQEKKQNS